MALNKLPPWFNYLSLEELYEIIEAFLLPKKKVLTEKEKRK